MLHKHDKDTKDIFFLWPLNFDENVIRTSFLTTPISHPWLLPNKDQIFQILCFSLQKSQVSH